MVTWRTAAVLYASNLLLATGEGEITEEGWNRGQASCGTVMRYDNNANPPAGWIQCYIDQRDTNWVSKQCKEIVKQSKACGGHGALNFGCWHGKTSPAGWGAALASNNVVKNSCVNNRQQSTKLSAWDKKTTTLGIGIRCPPFNKPVPDYKNLKKLACGTKMRHDDFAKTPNSEWFQCYIDQRDTKYHNWQCKDIVKQSNVCGGKGYYNFGCWHGTTKSPWGATYATNNVVTNSCVNNRQQSTRLNAWSWQTTTLGICIRCKPFKAITTTTTTTTTTTKAEVVIQTHMLPEFMTWTITTGNGKKTVCKGGPYSDWYTKLTDPCKLKAQSYEIKCSNPKVKGFAGGYVKIGRNRLCDVKKYGFDVGASFSQKFIVK